MLFQLGRARSSLGCWPRATCCLNTVPGEEGFRESSPVNENAEWDRCGKKRGAGVNSRGQSWGEWLHLGTDIAEHTEDMLNVLAFLQRGLNAASQHTVPCNCTRGSLFILWQDGRLSRRLSDGSFLPATLSQPEFLRTSCVWWGALGQTKQKHLPLEDFQA
jgi:hypothetical protein